MPGRRQRPSRTSGRTAGRRAGWLGLLLLVLGLGPWSAAAGLSGQAHGPERDWAELYPAGFREVLVAREAGNPFVAVVLERQVPPERLPDQPAAGAAAGVALRPERLLLLLCQAAGGDWRIHTRADRALPPYGFDPFFPDSLVDVVLAGASLTIHHYGGGNPRWGRTDLFGYRVESGRWQVRRVSLEQYSTRDLEAVTPVLDWSPPAGRPVDLQEHDFMDLAGYCR